MKVVISQKKSNYALKLEDDFDKFIVDVYSDLNLIHDGKARLERMISRFETKIRNENENK
jgi:hypothetical protein